MTGTAYRRSAELAGVVGPYDGYARNADAAQAGHAQARRGQRRDPPVGADRRAIVPRGRPSSGSECLEIGDEERLAQRAGLACSPRPAPSA